MAIGARPPPRARLTGMTRSAALALSTAAALLLGGAGALWAAQADAVFFDAIAAGFALCL